MGIPYRRASPNLGSVGTTKYINITTAAAQQIFLDSGFTALHIFNIGSGNLIWGDSNIAVNSGAYLFVNAGKGWESLQDGWSIFFRADSVSTIISVNEYSI